MEQTSSRLPQGRAQLVRVLASAGDVIRVDDVVKALDLNRTAAAQRLSRWMEQGWINRVGRGAYVAAAIDTLGAERTLDDPWILVPALFAPACPSSEVLGQPGCGFSGGLASSGLEI